MKITSLNDALSPASAPNVTGPFAGTPGQALPPRAAPTTTPQDRDMNLEERAEALDLDTRLPPPAELVDATHESIVTFEQWLGHRLAELALFAGTVRATAPGEAISIREFDQALIYFRLALAEEGTDELPEEDWRDHV